MTRTGEQFGRLGRQVFIDLELGHQTAPVGKGTVAALALTGQVARAELVQFDFVSEPGNLSLGALVQFNGDSRQLTFPNADTGFDFIIANSSDPGLQHIKGNIDGTFTVGSISTFETLEMAPVVGTGVFSLTDPSGKVLSAAVQWNDIFVFAGSHGGMNTGNAPNLTGWSYPDGSYAPFLKILDGVSNSHTANISFQFSPPQSLASLMAPGAHNTTTYSGSASLQFVPEPTSWIMLSGAAIGLLLLIWRRRRSG